MPTGQDYVSSKMQQGEANRIRDPQQIVYLTIRSDVGPGCCPSVLGLSPAELIEEESKAANSASRFTFPGSTKMSVWTTNEVAGTT